ncbi:DnaD domain protein [Halobacillus sp. A1]|uniref:replication initiation and membrane attachment family protein n=1 Tax=Halobacillus sp. A1 TaxID=2880262 RepID=UPI0020A694D0|nr:DnaD domain protein [Halobacillus sp. A1]MCP3030538.1 DnaD domain protein [Halobacillus sp. A1]
MDSAVGKLLPVDGFLISRKGVFPQNAQWALTHLYQPVIGQLAVSLYQFLCTEQETSNGDDLQTHHTLMTYLSTPLDKIYEARQKLEAIGLLRTFLKNEEEKVYIYEIRPPFAAEEFISDTFLSLLLQHEIGIDKFKQLKKRLMRESISYEGFTDITESFDKIFHHNFPAAVQSEGPKNQEEPRVDNVRKGPVLMNHRIDFNWLHEALTQRMYPADKILSGMNRKVIIQLASLYNLSSTEIERALTWAINEDNELNLEEFKSACHDFMKSHSQVNANVLNQRERIADDSTETKSKEDQFVQLLEQISPKELLEDLSNGHQAADQDMKMIRDVMTEQGVSPGVMNVLVHYVLLKTDMKLSKPYLEKIASHWARKNVTTVRQAMNLAKAEHQKYQQWGQQKNQYRKKSTEVIPEWFKKQDEKREQEQTKSQSFDSTELEKRIRMLSNKENGM